MTQLDLEPAPSRATRRRRRWPAAVAVAVVLVLLAGAAGAVGYYTWCGDTASVHRPASIDIPEGATGDRIVAVLHDEGVIRCGGLVGRSLLQRTGKSGDIRAGSYRLWTGMSMDQVVQILTAAPKAKPTVSITFPEGYTVAQMGSTLQRQLHLSAATFDSAATSGTWSLPPYLPKGASSVEGFLFPDTYELLRGDTRPADVIRRLLEEFRTQTQGLAWANAKRLGVSPYQVVTIASMIEREARIPRERPRIAAVIYNRLDAGMTLGIDATIRYVDPDPSNGLTESDLRIHSPYNTRTHTGLPPTPIANPGIASLRAALEPAHVGDRYYVLCGRDGHHAFSVSYGAFLDDVRRCQG